jgi:hypothetical protein
MLTSACFLLRRGHHSPSGVHAWMGRNHTSGFKLKARVVRGQSPSPLTGMFFFFLRIFLRPGIMFVSLFVCLYVCPTF